MDLQFIQNAGGAAYYVCSYICKSEPDDLKNALGNLIYNILNENPSTPRNVRLMKIGLCMVQKNVKVGHIYIALYETVTSLRRLETSPWSWTIADGQAYTATYHS